MVVTINTSWLKSQSGNILVKKNLYMFHIQVYSDTSSLSVVEIIPRGNCDFILQWFIYKLSIDTLGRIFLCHHASSEV